MELNYLLLAVMLVLLVYILPIILFFKIWGMTKDIRLLKRKYLDMDKSQEAKIAFMKGDSIKAKDILDSSFFNDVINLAKFSKKGDLYTKQYPLLIRRYENYYYSMSLTPPNFEHYKDITNIP